LRRRLRGARALVDPIQHYSGSAAEEVAAFLAKRWAAAARGDQWLRWVDGDKPLRVSGPEDVRRLARGGWRSFYGTIELFSRLETREDVEELYPLRVEAVTSFIDIDIVDDSLVESAWRHAIAAGEALYRALCRAGVCESVYMLWSGAGVHVRIHEAAFQGSNLDPLLAAYLAAEYAIRAARRELEDAIAASGGAVKVENIVGRKRLFTAPMSLHRRLDRVAVAFKPEDASLFTLSWTLPGQARHDPEAWRRHKPGEAAALVARAAKELGAAAQRTVLGARRPQRGATTTPSHAPREPGRFPVMALLQAARYYLLTGDLEKAKSFGLNRAIFYAWAKYHGPARGAGARARGGRRPPGRPAGNVKLQRAAPGLDDEVPVSESGWFAMGGVEQTPEDFDRNVARRFEEAGIPFEEAWRAALEYVSRFPRSVLRDPQRFYKRVYEPVRDSFVETVVLGGRPRAREAWEHDASGRRAPGGGKRGEGGARRRSLLDWLD